MSTGRPIGSVPTGRGPVSLSEVTPNVHRAGAAVGLTPLTRGQAMRVGLLVGWTTAAAAAMDPRPSQRPVGTLWIALTVVSGTLGLLLGDFEGLVAVAAAGAGLYFLMILVLGAAVEGRLFMRADRVWLITSDAGRACAKVNVTPSGAWKLTSVAAWPFKRHLGTRLVGDCCRDADDTGCEIVLLAQNDRVAGLYRRHHFVEDPQRGRRAMRRMPAPPDPQSGLVPEEMNLG